MTSLVLKRYNDYAKTYDLCYNAIKENARNLQYVPRKFRDRKMCERAFLSESLAVRYMPEDILDYDFCKYIVMMGRDYNVLRYIPEKYRTYEICFISIKNNNGTLDFVKYHLRNYQLCWLSVYKKGFLLEYVPEHLKTYEICLVAMKQNAPSIRYIPKEYLDNNTYRDELILNGFLYGNGRISKKYITPDIALRALNKRPELFNLLPKSVRDNEKIMSLSCNSNINEVHRRYIFRYSLVIKELVQNRSLCYKRPIYAIYNNREIFIFQVSRNMAIYNIILFVKN